MIVFRFVGFDGASECSDVGSRQNVAVGTGAGLALAAEGAIAGHIGTENLAAYAITGGKKESLGQWRSKLRDQAQPGSIRQIQNRGQRKTDSCGPAMQIRKMQWGG